MGSPIPIRQSIAENVWITLAARLATAIGIPLALIYVQNISSAIRDLNDFAIETRITIEAVKGQQQSLQSDQKTNNASQLVLGERVRDLEEATRTLSDLLEARIPPADSKERSFRAK